MGLAEKRKRDLQSRNESAKIEVYAELRIQYTETYQGAMMFVNGFDRKIR